LSDSPFVVVDNCSFTNISFANSGDGAVCTIGLNIIQSYFNVTNSNFTLCNSFGGFGGLFFVIYIYLCIYICTYYICVYPY
jgi:hypothetical protein